MILLSKHAAEQMQERRISVVWVEAAIAAPDWREADPNFPERTRSYRAEPEFGGRMLRVVHRPEGDDVMVITVHFDRTARRRRR
jgi:hypothetical protein